MLAGCTGVTAIPFDGIAFLPVPFMVYLRRMRFPKSCERLIYFEREE